MSIVATDSISSYFNDVVEDAMKARHVEATELTTRYIVALLSDFARPDVRAGQALDRPLSYVSGSPGNEVFVAIRNGGGSGLIGHNDKLYLQFRNGKLAGWKGDWSRNWMWQ